MFASLDELDEYAKTCGRGSKDFRDLIGYNGSLRKIIESCKQVSLIHHMDYLYF